MEISDEIFGSMCESRNRLLDDLDEAKAERDEAQARLRRAIKINSFGSSSVMTQSDAASYISGWTKALAAIQDDKFWQSLSVYFDLIDTSIQSRLANPFLSANRQEADDDEDIVIGENGQIVSSNSVPDAPTMEDFEKNRAARLREAEGLREAATERRLQRKQEEHIDDFNAGPPTADPWDKPRKKDQQ
jgi:hypothetical protein